MKQTLPDYIRRNEDLRQALLVQDGGIMKFLAEHLDTDGNAELFTNYQKQCVDIFLKKNKWNLHKVWRPGAETERAALGETEHISKELKYQATLMPKLSMIPTEIAEIVSDFTEQYLIYAYIEDRRRRYPDGMTNNDVYQEVKGLFHITGKAYKCMEIILSEHHSKDNKVKTESDVLTEFCICQYVNQFTHGHLIQLRQAIAELLKGKSQEECVLLATDMMKEVRPFAQRVYNEGWVQYLRDVKFPVEDDIYFSKTGKHLKIDYFLYGAKEREKDGKWLREEVNGSVLKELSSNVKTPSMRYYFTIFLGLLNDLGRFWAAQLLLHGFDMHNLEKEHNCILTPVSKSLDAGDDEVDYSYYIDRKIRDVRGQCCIFDIEQAKKLLNNLYNKQEVEHHEDFNSVLTQNQTKQAPASASEKKSVPKKKSAKASISRTSLKPSQYKTLKYFRHNEGKEFVKKQGNRVHLLYKKWQTGDIKNIDGGCWGWLPPEVTPNTFRLFFEGKDVNCSLKFVANKTILSVFLDRLLNYTIPTSNGNKRTSLIEHQNNQSASKLVTEQFNATPNFNKNRLNPEDIARIKESIFILDYTSPLPQLDNGGDNDFDETDTTLMLVSKNIDLGIGPKVEIEHALKLGTLKEGKHT